MCDLASRVLLSTSFPLLIDEVAEIISNYLIIITNFFDLKESKAAMIEMTGSGNTIPLQFGKPDELVTEQDLRKRSAKTQCAKGELLNECYR